MKITPKQYAKSLLEAVAENSGKEKIYLDNFLKIIGANNDEKNLPRIIEEFKKISEAEFGVKEVAAISAIALSDEVKGQIIKKMENVFKAKIKLSEKVDPKILGGLILQVEDEVLDASVITALNKLKRSLSNETIKQLNN